MTKAIEIPLAMVLGSPVPNSVIIWKVSIIPTIVPKRPISGATIEISFISQLSFSIGGLSLSICSAILSSKVSVSAFGLSSAIFRTLPKGLSVLRAEAANCESTAARMPLKVTNLHINSPTPPRPST